MRKLFKILAVTFIINICLFGNKDVNAQMAGHFTTDTIVNTM